MNAESIRLRLGGIASCSHSYYHALMELLSVKLPGVLRRLLAEEARRRNVSQSTIVRESLERALLANAAGRHDASCADLAGELIGSFRSGRRDLATNKRLIEEALLADARRGRERNR